MSKYFFQVTTVGLRSFVLALGCAVALTACGSWSGATVGDVDVSELRSRVDSVGYSRFDDAGVEDIKKSRILKLDARTGAVTMESVGMTDMLGPAIGGAREPEMLLVFDGPQGRDEVVSRTLMVLGSDMTQMVSEITFWRSASSLDEAFMELSEDIHRWGFSAERVNGWIDAMSSDRSMSDKYVLSAGVSPSGLIMQVEVKYDPGKPVVLRYMLHLRPSFYEPKSLEVIRKTGQIPDFAYPNLWKESPAPRRASEAPIESKPR